MSFTSKKREEIKKYIFRKIADHDENVICKTVDNFGVSITTVKRYLQEELMKDTIREMKGETCPYALTEDEFRTVIPMGEGRLEEDLLFARHIAPMLDRCNENVYNIWQYSCAEMLNNAIEHSKGERLGITVRSNVLYTTVAISDDGLGVFCTLLNYMSTHGWTKPEPEDALAELYKGKITSDRENHSGEGIFFTSKMMDSFILWSDAMILKCGNCMEPEVVQSRLAAYASRIWKEKTMIVMSLENETERNCGEVFHMYADVDEGFIRTCIPIKEACITGEPVARSQARRICNRLEEFQEVILDFRNVGFMGQGFADELFRVFACAHPQVRLLPVNMLPEVERMIRHISRGNMPQNIQYKV